MMLEEIVIDGRPIPIHADLRSRRPDQERPLIIICHGFLGHKRWGFLPRLSEHLAGIGLHVVTMSFSLGGVDNESGRITRPDEFAGNTVTEEIADLEHVVRRVRAGSLPVTTGGKGLGLFGYSRGAAVALLVAGKLEEVRSLVTWATPSRLDRYSKRRKELWKREGALVFDDPDGAATLSLPYSYYEDVDAHRRERNLVRAASSLAVPHLMIHGAKDAAVTLREAQALAAVERSGTWRLEVIEECGHLFNVKHPMEKTSPELERAITLTGDWFKKAFCSMGENL